MNHSLGLLDATRTTAIVAACDEVMAGAHEEEFPLVVWQTGSGTQTNMNMNEVLANRASELPSGPRGEGRFGAPQRRREQEPVEQRRLSYGDAPGGGGCADPQTVARPACVAHDAGRQG